MTRSETFPAIKPQPEIDAERTGPARMLGAVMLGSLIAGVIGVGLIIWGMME